MKGNAAGGRLFFRSCGERTCGYIPIPLEVEAGSPRTICPFPQRMLPSASASLGRRLKSKPGIDRASRTERMRERVSRNGIRQAEKRSNKRKVQLNQAKLITRHSERDTALQLDCTLHRDSRSIFSGSHQSLSLFFTHTHTHIPRSNGHTVGLNPTLLVEDFYPARV